ncbi:MAG: DUF2029 domain-containing protein [Ardenticatenaceae bacterium]|nr:DUF2029 domain-containing protein [Ardenticatenaceae bacterium]MCB9444575.1 DUF2029 domain-containing protein [Ardenticatenaceae bacterium]
MSPAPSTPPRLSLWHYLVIFSLFFISGWLFLTWFQGIFPDNYWPLGVDVYPRWSGTRAFWQGASPYSAAVDSVTQRFVYGRLAFPGEDTFGYYYPAYASVVLAPLALLPAATAAVLWPALMWAVLGVTAVATIELLPNRPKPLTWAALLLSIFLFRPALLTIFNGQYGLFIVAMWGLSWLLIRQERDGWAGLLLALATIKPSLGVVPALLLMLWALMRKRKKLVISFVTTMCMLLAISFIQIGWWLPDFLAELSEYNRDLGHWKPADVLTLPGIIWLIEAVALTFLGFRQALVAKRDFPAMLFWGGLFLNMVLTPHTAEYDLVVVLLPLIGHIPEFSKVRWGRGGLILLLWLYWLAWLIWWKVLGYPSELWLRAAWMFYPQVILAVLLGTAVSQYNSPPVPVRD